MHSTHNTLPETTRRSSIQLLQACLYDATDLMTQTKQAHWNVRGRSFLSLHELFDRLHTQIDGHVDSIAERLVALGGQANGTVRTTAKHSTLKEYPLQISHGSDHISAMSSQLGDFGQTIRSAISAAEDMSDADTADLLTGISRDIDQALWMVEAHKEEV